LAFLSFLIRILATFVVAEGVSAGLLVALPGPARPWHELAHFGLMAILGVPLAYWWVFRPMVNREVSASVAGERQVTSTVLDTVRALVVVLDREGRIFRFNGECQRVTGYSEQEVLGRTFDFLVPPGALDGVRDAFEAVASGAGLLPYETPWITKDGRERMIRWSNGAERDAHGVVHAVVSTGVDVTDEREATRLLQLFQAGIDRSGEVIFLTDPLGRIIYVNPMFTEV